MQKVKADIFLIIFQKRLQIKYLLYLLLYYWRRLQGSGDNMFRITTGREYSPTPAQSRKVKFSG
jgi:hypothetical protein